MVGRPKGAKDKKQRGYTPSAATYHQRVMANMSKCGNEGSKIYQAVMKEQGLSEEQITILQEEKINIWKKFDTPSIMLMREYADFKTMVNAKMLKGDDPTDKDMRECLKLLLDIAKEINRLEAVPKSQKFDAFTKSFGGDKEIVFDVEPVEVEPNDRKEE